MEFPPSEKGIAFINIEAVCFAKKAITGQSHVLMVGDNIKGE